MTQTVVLVDDVPEIRFLLREMLEEMDEFRVVGEAANGADGLRLCEQLRPDLIILDVAMPVMDGMEALPHIRAQCPSATIVMLSGFVASRLREDALRNGADEYVEKGVLLAKLQPLLRTLCNLDTPARRQ